MRSTSLAGALLALLLPACSILSPGDGGVAACTLEFRSYTVQVVDADGQPVDGLTATVRNLRTGEVLDLGDGGGLYTPGDGRYLLVTDGQVGQLSEEGDRLHFRAVGNGLVAEAEYVFTGGPCHVERVSGPERVVAVPAGR